MTPDLRKSYWQRFQEAQALRAGNLIGGLAAVWMIERLATAFAGGA